MYKIVFFLLLSGAAVGQRYTGTKTTYPFKQADYTPVPRGYTPAYVNYVGRHGARFMTKPGSDVKLLELLSKAQITPLGDSIKTMITQFLQVEKDNYENISLLGAEEQHQIGTRLKTREAAAFKGRGVTIEVTHKKRTRQSADGFLKAFADYKGKKEFKLVQEDNENVLRFYDLSPAYDAYKDGKIISERLDSLEHDPRTKATADRVSAKLFAPSYTLTDKEKEAVTEWLYDLYSIQFSAVMEKEQHGLYFDFSIPFTDEDLQWLDYKGSAADFLEKGAGLDTLGIQSRIAAPLLLDLIQSTDALTKGQLKLDAVLRFSHAEAISPLATLMGIPEASHPSNTIFSINWKADEIIPLSANIQWLIYGNGKNYIVKVLLNEREVALPIKTACYPYYRWEDVKGYYLNKLKTIGVKPGDDMHKYLLEVK